MDGKESHVRHLTSMGLGELSNCNLWTSCYMRLVALSLCLAKQRLVAVGVSTWKNSALIREESMRLSKELWTF